jgi:hypothetical protein
MSPLLSIKYEGEKLNGFVANEGGKLASLRE